MGDDLALPDLKGRAGADQGCRPGNDRRAFLGTEVLEAFVENSAEDGED